MNDDEIRPAKDCYEIRYSPDDTSRKIWIVPKTVRERLSDKEYLDYHAYRDDLLSYLLKFGKSEKKAKGYSPYTVYADNYRLVDFDRWMWEHHGGYTIPPTQDDATAYLEEIAYSDQSQTSKGKIQEALNRYSKFLQHKFGQDEWEFEWTFDGSGRGSEAPPDYLSVEERRKIRQAALGKGSIPSPSSLSQSEYRQWKGYVAQELGKPMDEVTDDDWKKVHGWKITSLVWTNLDAGLRPVEVARAKTSWVDTSNSVLRIPKEDSSKNVGNWTVSLTERTTKALKRWIIERDMHDRYEDTDLLWLTMRGNPYGSRTLGRLLRELCDDAGIDYTHRKMSWYAIRHSVGTYMTRERDLAAAKAQLRHKSALTTMKYDQAPVEDRQDALEKMG